MMRLLNKYRHHRDPTQPPKGANEVRRQDRVMSLARALAVPRDGGGLLERSPRNPHISQLALFLRANRVKEWSVRAASQCPDRPGKDKALSQSIRHMASFFLSVSDAAEEQGRDDRFRQSYLTARQR